MTGHDGAGAPGDLHGHAATDPVDTHLEQVAVNESGRTQTYHDPRDGSKWVLEYPPAEGDGDGFPRLRRQSEQS